MSPVTDTLIGLSKYFISSFFQGARRYMTNFDKNTKEIKINSSAKEIKESITNCTCIL